MRKKLFTSLLLFAMTGIGYNAAFAGKDKVKSKPPKTPINSGVILLLAAGAGLGGYKVLQYRKALRSRIAN
jgi:hypothetical protein